jgi:hypothetical protein
MKNYQAIFQSQNGNPERNNGWLDYCREQVPLSHSDNMEQAQAWADYEASRLAKRIGCSCRVHIEDWS